MGDQSREAPAPAASLRAGVEHELPSPSDARMRAAIEVNSAGYLRPVWWGLSVVYAIFAVAHLVLLPPAIRGPMSVLATLSSVGFGIGLAALRRGWLKRQSPGTATLLSGVTALVIWLNSAVHLILVGQPRDSTNLIIVLVGCAMFMLDRRWFLALFALCVGAWLVAFLRSPPNAEWLHFGFALLSSGLLAALIYIGRRNDLRRIQGLLIVEEKREEQLEMALQDARLRLASIWQNSRDGLVMSDTEGRVLAVNRAMATLAERAEAELTGRPWLELLAPHYDVEAAQQAYAEIYRSPETAPAEEREVHLAGGKIVWVALSHLRMPQPEGEPLLLTLVRDVTERRRFDEERRTMERRVQEAQRLESLGVLAGGIAHDFNNLLAGILGHTELTAGLLPPDSPGHRHLQLARTAAERAADLCQQMLAYAGQGRFVERDLNLNVLVTETAELLASSWSKDISVDLRLAQDLRGVRADPTRLRQVLMNLMLNGAEAMAAAGGLLQVTTRPATVEEVRLVDPEAADPGAAGYVCLEVKDEGCGMTEETRSRIFEPFFTTKFAGRGLGLSAVLGITRAHHGVLGVDSVVGKGTRIRVYLPALAWVVPELVEVVKPAPPAPWRGTGTVLVVDDEPFVRQVLRALLQRLGFEVLLAEHGEEALERLREPGVEIRLVFLDLTMPRMDGAQTMVEMRKLATPPPVILMSGYAESEILRQFADHPPTAFLQKPFNAAALTERVRQVLDGTAAPIPPAPTES